jgi:hypothetical protein
MAKSLAGRIAPVRDVEKICLKQRVVNDQPDKAARADFP